MLRIIGEGDHLHLGYTNNLSEQIKRWVIEEKVICDGLVPLLNFENMSLYYRGRRVIIKNGIGDSVNHCFLHNLTGGGVNFVID